VAGSVEGLNPESVSIVDADGNVLYDAFAAIEDASTSNIAEDQFQMRRRFETELEQRLRALLEQVYGPGRAVAMVSAEMDFDAREQTSIVYDGENAVPRSTHVIREESENVAPPAEEVGEPNIPGQAAVAGAAGDSSYLLEEEIVNYEISETREYIEAAPGQIERLSTAVMIDNEGDDPFLEEQVEQLVNSAVGFEEARGDAVTVQIMPFDTTWIEEPEPAVPVEELPVPLSWLIIGAAILLLLVLVVFFVLRGRARRRAEEEREFDAMALEQELESRAREEAEQLEPGEAESKARAIRKLAQEEPESVAGLLKTWLTEE
ncbi:MAG: flagellar M-ring protein FliF C-terminal domain-containing protein, partial [Bacillota bacterium]